MEKILDILRNSIPEAIGGIVGAAIISLWGIIYGWIKNRPSKKVLVFSSICFLLIIIIIYLLTSPISFVSILKYIINIITIIGCLGSLYIIFKRRVSTRSLRKLSSRNRSIITILRTHLNKLGLGLEGPWMYRSHRKWAILGLIFLVLVSTAGVNILNNDIEHLQSKFIIVLTQFGGPDPSNYRVTEKIYSKLCDSLCNQKNVEIIAVEESISETNGSERAINIGKKYGASVVIWGWYGKTDQVVPISVNFEILRALKCSFQPRPAMSGEIQELKVNDINSFSLQQNLSEELSLLTNTTLGLAYFSNADYQSAIEQFSYSLQLSDSNPSKEIAYYYRGLTYFLLGDLESALSDYTRALEINPKNAYTYSNIASVYMFSDMALAIQYMDKAIELEPNETDHYADKSIIYHDFNQFTDSLNNIEYALEIDNENPNLHRVKGYSLARVNRFGQAIDEINIALDGYKKLLAETSSCAIKQDIAQMYLHKAWVYSQEENYRVALLEINKAIKMNKYYGNAYYHRANIKASLGYNHDNYLKDYYRALEYGVQDDYYEAIMEIFRQLNINY